MANFTEDRKPSNGNPGLRESYYRQGPIVDIFEARIGSGKLTFPEGFLHVEKGVGVSFDPDPGFLQTIARAADRSNQNAIASMKFLLELASVGDGTFRSSITAPSTLIHEAASVLRESGIRSFVQQQMGPLSDVLVLRESITRDQVSLIAEKLKDRSERLNLSFQSEPAQA